MGVKAPKGGGPRWIPPTGLTPARCVWIIDLGTQEQIFKGEKKLVHQIQFSFECPEHMHAFSEDKGEQPAMLSRKFTVSLGAKSNTKPFIEGWLGRELTEAEKADWDFSSMINKAGMINIMHVKDKKDPSIVYANIGAISPMMKGSKLVKAINPIIDYTIGAENQWEEFEKIYPQMQDKIKLSPEWKSEAAKHNYNVKGTETATTTDDIEEDEF